ncbi:MAG: XRE family transcriptional regulator [Bacteroidota bacterium]|nr:XRE family transcriptional regulator [Bacteroidota bacterium]
MKQTENGNIFLDLGFDPSEAEVLQMRSRLMIDLRMYIQENRLTQIEAARIFGISQSRVSDLVRGKWQKFNLEMLIKLEGRIGKSVQLALSP